MNAQKNTKIVAQKPFCKVCHDAGKSESEYTSHFVRSDLGPKGKVVCPTLLSLECRYCYEKGHTVSFCAVLKKQKNADKKTVARIEFAEASVQSPLKAPKKATNSFRALDQDSDEEVSKKAKKQTKVKEEFPVLCGVVKKADNQTSGAISYAAKAAKALDMPVLTRQTHYKEKPVVVKEKKRWADWTDSEDDEDDEEEVESGW